jgi:hypothetical protein
MLIEYLKKIDIYGEPVSLTFHKRHKYKTAFGGVLSFISVLGILSFFFFLLTRIINKDKRTVFKTVYRVAHDDTQSLLFNLDNFDIAL